MLKTHPRWVALCLIIVLLLMSCTPNKKTVVVTATPPVLPLQTNTSSVPTQTPIRPTPNPTRVAVSEVRLNPDGTYTVQAGDTLAVISARFGVSVTQLMAENSLTDPNLLEVGQSLRIPQDVPAPPPAQGFKTIPDSELVFGPSAANFDVAAYVKGKNGFLYAYSQDLDGELWSGVELIDRIAHEFSVNPRLLLALLEYQSGWLSNPTPTEAEILYPYGIINTNVQGLYLQLRGTANLLNAGYYGWRYRGLTVTSLADGEPLVFAPELNAGTVAVQYFFAQINVAWQWNQNTSETGFFQTYLNMFGDPFIHAVDPLVPNNLEQPTMTLPFAKGETWYFTGGPHGGFNTGSAWAAIDFAPPAPPDELINAQGFCYVSPNWVTAVAPGVIARSGNGFVVLDLDGDGNEHTGWVVVYLHIASQDSLPAGVRVKTGDPLGHPSCEGGFSNATHLHFARKYNGEWIPITCHFCASDIQVPPMVLSGWTFIGYQDQEYQGYAVHVAGGGTKVAEQGRDSDINAFSY